MQIPSPAVAAKLKKEPVMWKKIVWKIVMSALASIPWERLAKEVLDRLAAKIRESGRTLETLSPTEFLQDVELIFARYIGVDVDITGDGHIGPPPEDAE